MTDVNLNIDSDSWEASEPEINYGKPGFKFEKLIVWQEAMKIGEDVNNMVKQFPAEEKFNLCSQMVRAVDSVALNISEGAIGQSTPEFKRFLGYSIRSVAEVVTCLHKAKLRKYIDEVCFDENYEACYRLINKLTALKKSLQ